MSLARRLAQTRKAAGMSQKELAEAAGISQQQLSKLERGVALRTAYIVELAEELGVRSKWLHWGCGPKTETLF
ncbi:MAG: helix-turn-helix transcriptional regulator [Pseudomonadota bacterium]